MRDIDLVLVLLDKLGVDSLVEHINRGGCELSSAYALLEEEVKLGKGAASGLWDSEEGVNQTEKAERSLK
jgi:hypothetical protein